MIHYRSLIGASLLSLCASVPVFAQQGAAGGTLYKDPAAKSYLPPRAASSDHRHSMHKRMSERKTSAMSSDASASRSPQGTTNGDGASGGGNPSLTGPKFGGG